MGLKFRNWKVYKDARKFRREIKKEIISKIPKTDYELKSQLERALISVVLNIAEGAYRKSDKDLSHFLNQADTSVNEIIACLDLCLDDGFIDAKLHQNFLLKSEEIIAQLAGFRRFLKK